MIAIGDLPHSVHQFLRFKATADYADNQNRISILKIRFILSKFRAAPQSKRACHAMAFMGGRFL